MRLWHKDLISVLPRQQLISQYRECCLIAKNIAEKGTPNHILVNRIMDYPLSHFYAYTLKVHHEMIERGYKCDWSRFEKHISLFDTMPVKGEWSDVFNLWHDKRYLLQCFYNLQEKYDCGGITENEWDLIYRKVDDELYG